jgi:hypothetical protein
MLKKLTYWLIFFGISLVFCEICLRVFNYFVPTPIIYDVSYNRFRAKPHSDNFGFKINTFGFKDTEFGPKKNDVYRIVGLGDSFAFGVVPYQYNYLTLLEEQLNKAGHKSEVFNMGISNTGPLAYWTLLGKEGLGHKPDMVLLSFFIGNDFVDDIKTKRIQLISRSYLASLVNYLVKIRKSKFLFPKYGEKSIYCDTCTNMSYEVYFQLEKKRGTIFWKENPLIEEGLETAMFYLSRIQTLCQENNVKLVIAILPDEMQSKDRLRDKVIAADDQKRPASQWDNLYPNRLLHQKLDELKIDYVDLYDVFRAIPQDTVLHLPNDSHWNIRGNKVAAEAITKYLAPKLP